MYKKLIFFFNSLRAYLSKIRSNNFIINLKIREKNIDEKEKIILKNLKEEGYYILEDFLPHNLCNDIIQRIDFFIHKYPEFVWRDKEKSDYRIWGSENISSNINDYFNNQFLKKIGQSYFSKSIVNYLCMANRVSHNKDSLGSGGGWHRDSFGSQYKTILYLKDVDENSGPFELILDSHKPKNIFYDYLKIKINYKETRFLDNQINYLLEGQEFRKKTLLAKAGSLIFVDTSTIHRGSPIKNERNIRYALTNYYYLDNIVSSDLSDKFTPLIKNNMY